MSWDDEEHFIDHYNHPPLGDETANAIADADQEALLQQIEAVKVEMRLNSDQETLAARNVQLNTLLQQYALGRRLRFGELG